MANIRGIVFDKDGTLFDYRGTWAVWCNGLLDELSGGDNGLKRRLARACGFDVDTQDFVPGSVIVNGTAGEVNATWAALLPNWTAEEVDAASLRHIEKLPNRPVCDLRSLFEGLAGNGFKLGLATNDYEVAAHQQLQDAGVADLFDFICGFDSGHGTKPGPGMIEAFSAKTALPVTEVAMVGDSTHDLGAGRAAGVGLTVGVLTGPARAEDIAHLADHVIADISGLPDLLREGGN